MSNHLNAIASRITPPKDAMAEVAQVMDTHRNRSRGAVVDAIPQTGFSEYDRPGAFFYDPIGRRIFIDTLRDNIRSDIEFVSMDLHINDPEYAERVAEIALEIFPQSACAGGVR